MRVRVIKLTGLPARYFWSERGSQLARTHMAREMDADRTGFGRSMQQCFHNANTMSNTVQKIVTDRSSTV